VTPPFAECRPDHPGRGPSRGPYRDRPKWLPQRGGADVMRLLTTPRVAPAAKVFPPAELAARLDLYAGRAAAGLPVCTGVGEPVPPGKEPVLCWACGRRCENLTWPTKVGWATRDAFGRPGGTVECYCPSCFAAWGWPGEAC